LVRLFENDKLFRTSRGIRYLLSIIGLVESRIRRFCGFLTNCLPQTLHFMELPCADIRKLFKPAGRVLDYLLTYSPDLDPLEHKWTQAKAIRRQKRHSVEELFAQHIL
jgi:transposase